MTFYTYDDVFMNMRIGKRMLYEYLPYTLAKVWWKGAFWETYHHVGDISQDCIVVVTSQQPTSNVVEEW